MPPTALPLVADADANTSDADLAARAAQGDTQAFARIMRRHNQLLFRTARSILHSDADRRRTAGRLPARLARHRRLP